MLENYQKKSHLCEQSEERLFSKKTFGCTFLPLINSFEFLQILGIYSIKRITKNSKEFSRGKNVSPKVFKVIDDESEIFLGIFKHSGIIIILSFFLLKYDK